MDFLGEDVEVDGWGWIMLNLILCFLQIPEIDWRYSTKRVLTMEFCDGGKVDDLTYMQNHQISSDEASVMNKYLNFCHFSPRFQLIHYMCIYRPEKFNYFQQRHHRGQGLNPFQA